MGKLEGHGNFGGEINAVGGEAVVGKRRRRWKLWRSGGGNCGGAVVEIVAERWGNVADDSVGSVDVGS